MQTMTLLNQTKIPVLGFGTYKITDPTLAKESVTEAICRGYRHVDTAAFYENEVAVGQAIRDTIAEGGLARKDLFVTSKVWKTENTYDKVMASFEKTMENLGLDYLDLYLVHWPASDAFDPDWKETNRQVWRAMIDIYRSGQVKAIGVSNFLVAKHILLVQSCYCARRKSNRLFDGVVHPSFHYFRFRTGYF